MGNIFPDSKMKIVSARLQQFSRAWLACALFALSALALAAEPVGQVLLVTGTAVRVDGAGERHPLGDKAGVYEGDTLETEAGALLQVKMVDRALVVLHGRSSLLIHTYHYDPDAPAENAARLDLLKGRARSVTGDLGESNHDAFRLNTPIAAIGIRGTDFETNTSEKRTRVRLNSGAIVIAPLGDNCPATALGPCKTDNSLLLTEQLESPVAELRATDTAPRLIELPEYDADSQGSFDGQKEEEQINSENQAERLVDTVGRGPGGKPQEPGTQQPEPETPWVAQVHWGRWGDVTGTGDGKTSQQLRAEGKEFVFRNDVFALFRDGFVSLGQGQASFGLQGYDAGVIESGHYTPVTLADGSLHINFNENTFDTALTVASGIAGGTRLSAGGTVDAQGMLGNIGRFRDGDSYGNMNVLGVLSNDGEQAGYLFTHTLNDSMSLQGVTQWQRH